MSKKQLQREIIIDVQDHDHWNTQDNGVLEFRDHLQPAGVDYRRFSRKVERWEYNRRTHVFHIKIPAHKWLKFVAEAFEQAGDYGLHYQMQRDQQAKATTFEAYVEGYDYDAEALEEIREAFEELRVYSQNHSAVECLAHRESLGLIT